MSSTDTTYDNYFIKHMHLPDIGKDGQHQLRDSLAVIFGAGAIGLPVLQTLLMSGIGRILVVDPDVVEASNLHRQFMYTQKDIGSFKVDCASAYARSFPHSSVATLAADVTDTVERVIRNANIVFECTDSQTSKIAVAKACSSLNIPHVVGALYKSFGTITSFGADAKSRYESVVSPENIQDCDADGVFAPLSMYLGTLQANIGLRLLLDPSCEYSSGKQVLIDGQTMSHKVIQLVATSENELDSANTSLEQQSPSESQPSRIVVVTHFHNNRSPLVATLNEPEDVLDWNFDANASAYIIACETGKRARVTAEILANKGFEDVYVEPLDSLDIKL